MSILSAIFSYAGDISLDVAGIQIGLIERRFQKLDYSNVAANEMLDSGIPWPDVNVRHLRPRIKPTSFGRLNQSGIPEFLAEPRGVPLSK